MTTVAPIPLRPLNRTRRRSSSVNAISDSSPSSSSSEFDPQHPRWTRGNRPDGKRCKRTRTANQHQRDGSFAQPPSPLKHSQQPFPAPCEDAPFWDQPSPFSSRLPPLAPTFGFPAPPTFATSTTDFALPSSSSHRARSRHASAGSPSSNNTFPFQQPSPDSSPKPYSTTFDDSSFSSLHSSAPPSPPSASTTPPSPLAFGFTGAANPAPPLFLSTALTSSAPTAMILCDLDENVPGAAAAEEEEEEDRKEAERLHRAAFEQLRKATQVEEEGFVDRLRRWEAERAQDRARAVRDESARLGSGSVDGGDEADDDEVEVTLDHPAPEGRLRCAGAAKVPNPVASAEVDELARRLRGGACELEDYALVREVQARSTAANA
ncbi:hypothetical protein JCM5296_004198 [Sporobolomyces johnsonii]